LRDVIPGYPLKMRPNKHLIINPRNELYKGENVKTAEWTQRHLTGLEGLSAKELTHLLDLAAEMKGVVLGQKPPTDALEGKTVATLFFEASTRTTLSFNKAARLVSAGVLGFSVSTSSTTKGETLLDTARNIEAMGVDVMVVRHKSSGAPTFLASRLGCSVVNAGDGAHEHPTQGLLDIFTVREKLGTLRGVTVGIVGDISHSRVARSNIYGLLTLGAKVILVGPATMVPSGLASRNVEISHNFDDVLPKLDAINMLRIQKERLSQSLFPSDREYNILFGLNRKRLARAPKGAIVMHPGPINRGVEITSSVADGKSSVILEQVTNGVAVRMAVLTLVSSVRSGSAK